MNLHSTFFLNIHVHIILSFKTILLFYLFMCMHVYVCMCNHTYSVYLSQCVYGGQTPAHRTGSLFHCGSPFAAKPFSLLSYLSGLVFLYIEKSHSLQTLTFCLHLPACCLGLIFSSFLVLSPQALDDG